jgi:hypothetical protein
MQFFIPWVFALFVCFYGAAAVLTREMSLRWKTGWAGVLLLGAAFGVLNEGLAARAFFDPASRSLGSLANHGRWGGVNWIWSIDAVLYHATFSAALPILLVHVWFPETKSSRWLGQIGLCVTGLLFLLASAVFLNATPKYPVSIGYLAGCWVVIAFLVERASRSSFATEPERLTHVPPSRFAVLGFFASAALLLHIYVVPSLVRRPPITLAVLICLVLGVARALRLSAGSQWTRSQQCGLLCGALGFFGLFAFFHEINPTRTYDARGMSVVGIATLVGLTLLWRRVRKCAE